ncbi:MAG: response regulator transcription factor [Clostridiales bacterium]|nr:response regulator transcription factor [Clostridiales bacterium]
MSNEQILILEDDIELNRGLCAAFKNDGRSVVSVRTIKEAKDQYLVLKPSLILLDINLPDGSGLDLLREIKEKEPLLPVIMLTANDTDDDIVKGFEYGADDYITKPFSLSVLRARVNSKLRKNSKDESIIELSDYSFDFSKMIFKKGDEPIELSKTEQKILRILVTNKGATVKREELIDKVWTDGSEFVDDNALSVSVKRLRDKLSTDRIKTVYGLGYTWVTDK